MLWIVQEPSIENHSRLVNRVIIISAVTQNPVVDVWEETFSGQSLYLIADIVCAIVFEQTKSQGTPLVIGGTVEQTASGWKRTRS